jgi:hypothetical protein
MKSYPRLEERSNKGVVLKLDFEKAYDKVDWDNLLKCVAQKGFHEEWCDRINGIIRNGTLFLKINNTRGSDFGSQWGVIQGDPFSPFLFNLVVEGLEKMIWQAQSTSLIASLVRIMIL